MAEKKDSVGDRPESISEDELDELYRSASSEFIARRNDLAKLLKARGETAAAAWVRRLSKPSASAALVNRLYWSRAEEMRELFAAGEQIRGLLLDGAPIEDQTRAAARRQRAIQNLIAEAERMERSEGREPSRSALHKVTRTLEALSVYGPGGSAVPGNAKTGPQAGRLDRDLDPPGFEAVLAMARAFTTAAPRGKPAGKPGRSAGRTPSKRAGAKDSSARTATAASAAREEEREQRQKARATVARLERTVATAEKQSKEAQGSRQAAERAVAASERALERAEAKLAELRARHEEACERLTAAAKNHRKSELILLTGRRELEASRKQLAELD